MAYYSVYYPFETITKIMQEKTLKNLEQKYEKFKQEGKTEDK